MRRLLWLSVVCMGVVTLAPSSAFGQQSVADASVDYIELEDGHTGAMVRIPVNRVRDTQGQALGAEPAQAASEERPAAPSPPSRGAPPGIRWLASTQPDCHRRGRRRICDGPLRVPEPSGDALRRATRLGLVGRRVAGRMLSQGPEAAWVTEAGERSSRQLLYPVPGGRLGRGVGLVRRGRNRSRPHNGIDIGARPGTPVVAVNPGLVLYSHNGLSGYGNIVMIAHSDATVSFYAHLRAAYVQAGQRVRRGETIGEVGSTGLATGPHLHFEWRRNGEPLDPLPRMQGVPPRRTRQ